MEKMICSKCNQEVKEEYNFCPFCSAPLTDIAKRLENEKKQTTELALLVKLIDYIKDEKDMKLIKGFIEKIS